MKRIISVCGLMVASLALGMTVAIPDVHARAADIRWDIIHISSFSPVTLEAGGEASAKAQDSSKITLTGSGTFVAPSGGPGSNGATTGGGTWETRDSLNNMTGSGTYSVTGLVRWEQAPGAPTSTVVDTIGDGTLDDNRAGLAVLRIVYSDGSHGVLIVSCHLPGNPPPQGPDAAPASVFEGITASKDFVDYWNRQPPVNGVDGNRTLFHVE